MNTKKKYITPQTEVLNIHVDTLMDSISLAVGTKPATGGGDAKNQNIDAFTDDSEWGTTWK